MANLIQTMKAKRREVPFNNLRIELNSRTQMCPRESGCDGLNHAGLPTEFKLKYLEITDEYAEPEDKLQDSSAALIRKHASEIQYLRLENLFLLQHPFSEDTV